MLTDKSCCVLPPNAVEIVEIPSGLLFLARKFKKKLLDKNFSKSWDLNTTKT